MAVLWTITVTIEDTGSLVTGTAQPLVDPMMKFLREYGEGKIDAGTIATVVVDYPATDSATVKLA